MLWGKHYEDYEYIVKNYLPMLMENGVDFYLNGHEHTLVYANYPFSQVEFDAQEKQASLFSKTKLLEYACETGIEMHFGEEEVKSVVFN